jgi:membrane protease YdiL (CAAX protease family)
VDRASEARTPRWPDAVAAFALVVGGGVAVVVGQRAGWIPGVVAEYLAHAWMAAIALAWFFALGRRFPIGRFRHDQLRPWYVLALLLVLINLGETIGTSPAASPLLRSTPTLVADLLFTALIVGPTEELVFRGLVQTSLNASIRASVSIRSWRLRWGTVVAALLFGLFHLVNLSYQGLGPTVQQVLTATILGLVFGVLYDRTHNLIGASLAHSIADFSGTVIPLLAWLLASR